MKKFIRYFLILIIAYFMVNLLIYLLMRSSNSNKVVSLNIPGNSPLVQITQARGSTEGGVVRGKITNNTNEEIKDKFLKLRFFSKRGVEMGNEYITIKDLKPGETLDFIADYNYKMVDKITGELIGKDELVGDINKATNNGKDKDKFNFSKINPKNIDFSKVDPRNINWEKLDPRNINWEKLDPRNINWDQLINGSRINTTFVVDFFGNKVLITPAILFGAIVLTGIYTVF